MILRLSVVSLLLPAWLLGGNLPDEPEKMGEGKGSEIRKKIDALDQKIGDLEAAKEALHAEAEKEEREAEKKQVLKEIKNECNGALKDMANELAERENEEGEDEEEKSVARDAFNKAFKKHVAACRAVNKQIQAIQDTAFLRQARDLAGQLEVLNRHWWMVQAPKLEFDVEYEAMSRHLEEEGTYRQRETLKKLRRLHEEDLMTREKEFESFKTRRQARKMMEKMKREIWGEEE